jgi:hypothetical protein
MNTQRFGEVVYDNPLAVDIVDEPYFTTYNPFYVLVGTESDDEEHWTKNELFSSDYYSNFILNGVNDELTDLITSMHSMLTRTSDNCVLGYQLIDYVMHTSQRHFVREDATVFVNRFILNHLVPVPYHFFIF